MPEGKTVTIQHLSSEQAGQTSTDTQLPETTGGGGIGGWISQNRMMLLIVGGGAVLGLIIYFYIKNQNAQTAAAATTDTGSSTDGTTTSPGSTGAPDFSPIENLLNQLQQSSDTTNQDLAQLLAQQQGTTSGGGCPSGMHKCTHEKSGCCCDGKNMVNKGDHCVKKGAKGGMEDAQFALGGSDMFNDMFNMREPFRNTGHKMVYALGGGYSEEYHGKLTQGTQIESGIPHMNGRHGRPSHKFPPGSMPPFRFGGGMTTMPPVRPGRKLHHW